MANSLRSALRAEVPLPARKVGERLAVGGKVQLAGREASTGGLSFAVRIGSDRFDVELWPGDDEWECSCEADGCAHAWAALCALEAGVETLTEAAEPPRFVLQLTSDGRWLRLGAAIREGGALHPFSGAAAGVSIPPTVRHLMKLSASWGGDRVPSRLYRQLVAALLDAGEVTLDGQTIQVSKVGCDVVAKAEATGAGWRLSLVDDERVERAWEGDPTLLLVDGTIRPRSFGRLDTVQRHQLATPLLFDRRELPRLTSEWLPSLAKAVRVVRSDDLPEVTSGGLRAVLELRTDGPVLEATARIVYGDPAVAELIGDTMLPLGGMTSLPARDRRGEQRLLTKLQEQLGLRPGARTRMESDRAVRFVAERVPRFKGEVIGRDAVARMTPTGGPLRPIVSWRLGGMHVAFGSDQALVSADRVLAAWRRGESWVSLADEGVAELPRDWLADNAELVDLAMSGHGGHLAPVAAALMEAADQAPPPDLAELVDGLRGGITQAELPSGLEAELRPYQLDGYRWLRFLGEHGLGGVLADDMGLGKTVQALAALLADRGKGPVLVVAPTSVLRNWESEAQRFAPELTVAVMHGAGREKLDVQAHDVVITSYALLRLDIDRLAETDWRCVVLDEAQAIKNADSQTAAAARRLKAERRVALTGTPIENHLGELWSLFEFLNPGFFGPRRRFDDRFSASSPSALAALRARIRPFVLRRLKSEVAQDLPPRTETILRCPLSPPQREAYEEVRRGARGLTQRMQVLAALTRLRQAACDAALLPDGPEVASGKLDVLLDALVEVADEGCRALVFSQWTSLLDRVEPRLREAGLEHVRLDGSTRDRAGVVAQFQDDDGPPVFLISLKAGGTGLNLTAADHVFLLDPWWNPAAEQQAVDRAHRIGQDKPVFVWKLVAERTVEERVLLLQQRKQAVADAVLEGADAPGKLTDDDFAALLA